LVHGQGLRLDKWLWFARLTKSRSDAQRLCESRRLRLDGRVIDRPSALVRAGSVVSFPTCDEVVVVRVRELYADLTRSRSDAGLTGALAAV
jgi:ribosome-associated heat shock protein Hsp15